MTIEDTLKEREKTHGSFRKYSNIAHGIKSSMRGFGYGPLGVWNTNYSTNWAQLDHCQREALEMICGKLARILGGDSREPDHWVDIAGYATLVEKELLKERARKTSENNTVGSSAQ